jgi:hypothetical protein
MSASAKPILLVAMNVPPEKESEFNSFYHHKFLPEMLNAAPEITSIRRYEESGTSGTLRWYNKQFLTIYELASDDVIDKVDELFERPSMVDLVGEFRQWKANHLRNFSRIVFRNSWSHARAAADGPFGGRPIFIWAHEMKSEMDQPFQEWYQNHYLPLQVADIPCWSACRRYESVGRDQTRRITVFEEPDDQLLQRCLNDLRAGHRVKENFEWQRRVEQAVLWQESGSYRIIYRRPG